MFIPKKPRPRRTDSPTHHKKIAGHVFGLENRYPEVEKTCRKYLCDEQPDAATAATAVSDSAEVSDRAAQLSKLRLSESNGASSDCRARAVSAKPIINSQLSISKAFALRLKALDLMGRLTHLPIYLLHCTISQQAVTLTLGALRENTHK